MYDIYFIHKLRFCFKQYNQGKILQNISNRIQLPPTLIYWVNRNLDRRCVWKTGWVKEKKHVYHL